MTNNLIALVNRFQPLVAELLPGGQPFHYAAWWGQGHQESSDNPAAAEYPGQDKGGIGLDQWTGGRRIAFCLYAQKRGKQWTDPETQIRFACQELGPGGSQHQAWVETLKTTALEAATATMMVLYEGPAGAAQELIHPGTTTANLPRRIEGARIALAAIQEMAAQTGTTKMTDPVTTAADTAAAAAKSNAEMILEAVAALEPRLFAIETQLLASKGVPSFVATIIEGFEKKLIDAAVAQITTQLGNLDIASFIAAEVSKLFGGTAPAAK